MGQILSTPPKREHYILFKITKPISMIPVQYSSLQTVVNVPDQVYVVNVNGVNKCVYAKHTFGKLMNK